MNFKIVSDSSADISTLRALPYETVPLKIITSEKEYTDDSSLNVDLMLDELKKYKGKSRSSCPNPDDYLRAFGDAENVFCVTITSGLSGSCNSALAAAKSYTESYPERRVHVIDTLSTGPECALITEKLEELILSGGDFDSVKAEISKYCEKTKLCFALESLHNLARNGRVSPIVAKLSGLLGIRVIGRASDAGTLEVSGKARGMQNAITALVNNIITEGYSGGRVRIHHARGEQAANILKAKLLDKFPSANIEIAHTRGLCSFYAELGGLLVGFETA